jgi:hypothetical protein
MDCPACGEPTEGFAVPDTLTDYAPDDADAVAVCTSCLHVAPPAEPSASAPVQESSAPADGEPGGPPDTRRISDALPPDEGPALGVLLAVDLLDSLASNRPAVEALVTVLEREGVDPVLTFERLADDPGLSPRVDLRRRSRQLEQLRS